MRKDWIQELRKEALEFIKVPTENNKSNALTKVLAPADFQRDTQFYAVELETPKTVNSLRAWQIASVMGAWRMFLISAEDSFNQSHSHWWLNAIYKHISDPRSKRLNRSNRFREPDRGIESTVNALSECTICISVKSEPCKLITSSLPNAFILIAF